MPFPPKGLKSQEHPLKHRFDYSFGLSAATGSKNSAWVTLVRNDNLCTQANAKTILVNPKNTSVDVETGPVCTPMSIIQNIKVIISLKKSETNNINAPLKIQWTPFFASFKEKYEAADIDTGVTVASVMQLTKDDTNEDIVPLSTNKLSVVGNSDKSHPLSTVNLAEAFDTHYNMTTNATMEDTPFNTESFHSLLTMGSNRGALKACLGRTRRLTMSMRNRDAGTKTFFINKFVPRAIRRIVPFTFFGILFHLPIESDIDSYYQDTAMVADVSQIGLRVLVRYDEWNEQHNNDM